MSKAVKVLICIGLFLALFTLASIALAVTAYVGAAESIGPLDRNALFIGGAIAASIGLCLILAWWVVLTLATESP